MLDAAERSHTEYGGAEPGILDTRFRTRFRMQLGLECIGSTPEALRRHPEAPRSIQKHQGVTLFSDDKLYAHACQLSVSEGKGSHA